MSETHNSSEEFEYLIHVTWTIADEEHGHSHALHNVHRMKGDNWDPKGFIQEFVEAHYPQWLPEGNAQIGRLNDRLSIHELSVYKVSAKDQAAWLEWSTEARAARDETSAQRTYEADMATIKALQIKWGLIDGGKEGAQEPQ